MRVSSLCVCPCAYQNLLCVCVFVFCLSRYGHFSGINRKVQLTYLRNGQPKASSEEEGTNLGVGRGFENKGDNRGPQSRFIWLCPPVNNWKTFSLWVSFFQIQQVTGQHLSFSYADHYDTTIMISITTCCCFSDSKKDGPSLLLVLKWGGELTPAGRVQAEELGRAFRCMYPGGQGTYSHSH